MSLSGAYFVIKIAILINNRRMQEPMFTGRTPLINSCAIDKSNKWLTKYYIYSLVC